MSKASVLIAEDEQLARDSLKQLLEDEGYRVMAAADGDSALQLLLNGSVEAALLDLRMPGRDGLSVLRELKRLPDPPAVLMMTAFGTSSAAIEAMTLGAFDYLTKPVNLQELLIQLSRAIAARRQAKDLEGYRNQDAAAANELSGSSPAMQRLYKLIGQVAPTAATVLIRGESGTGKELVARAIHQHSPRNARRMVQVNCASIPDALLESELFGHERGAFTGATQRRIGKFEFSAGGTIFLDEIGELSSSTQAKLLRVLQERTVERLGSNVTIPLDLRIVAATNRDLETAVREGHFREDLLFRLNVVSLHLPPLRERLDDLPELVRKLSGRIAARLGQTPPAILPETIAVLRARRWPGNVRELEHCLERAMILSRGQTLAPESVQDSVNGFDLPEAGLHEAVAALERQMIERALAACGGNRTRAAELLKINRGLLYDKLREFGIDGLSS